MGQYLHRECLDSRDDYHAELKPKTRFAANADNRFDSDVEYTSDECESDGEGASVPKNPYRFTGLKWNSQHASRMAMEIDRQRRRVD
ncbi:hypothetical protein D9613_012866 [Agrocybe pediades]|uniref:Uncharacterized protein n=1 Tax=Agrocybe pediades TaxID=84607 RepID=A0A8H4QW84_9AGAR|nr:hypothetical protein D9613_012866 [Agrocybe pediades]